MPHCGEHVLSDEPVGVQAERKMKKSSLPRMEVEPAVTEPRMEVVPVIAKDLEPVITYPGK